jgi:hypothetical protein
MTAPQNTTQVPFNLKEVEESILLACSTGQMDVFLLDPWFARVKLKALGQLRKKSSTKTVRPSKEKKKPNEKTKKSNQDSPSASGMRKLVSKIPEIPNLSYSELREWFSKNSEIRDSVTRLWKSEVGPDFTKVAVQAYLKKQGLTETETVQSTSWFPNLFAGHTSHQGTLGQTKSSLKTNSSKEKVEQPIAAKPSLKSKSKTKVEKLLADHPSHGSIDDVDQFQQSWAIEDAKRSSGQRIINTFDCPSLTAKIGTWSGMNIISFFNADVGKNEAGEETLSFTNPEDIKKVALQTFPRFFDFIESNQVADWKKFLKYVDVIKGSTLLPFAAVGLPAVARYKKYWNQKYSMYPDGEASMAISLPKIIRYLHTVDTWVSEA